MGVLEDILARTLMPELGLFGASLPSSGNISPRFQTPRSAGDMARNPFDTIYGDVVDPRWRPRNGRGLPPFDGAAIPAPPPSPAPPAATGMPDALGALTLRPPTSTFPAGETVPGNPNDEAAQAEAARAAWAARMRGAQRREARFEAPAVPFGALSAGMDVPGALAPAATPDVPAAPSPVAAPPQSDGSVPLPRDRPKEADGAPAGEPATDLSSNNQAPPLNIQPPAQTAPATAVAPAAAPTGFGSLASGLMKGLKDNSATLLALGAGFAGAPNIGQGISRAASAAIPASQADLRNRLLMQNQTQTLQALLAAKVPANMALAALTNPEIMKAVSARYLETKPFQHVVEEDMYGNKKIRVFDQNTGTIRDTKSAGGSGGDTAGAPTNINNDLIGEEWLAQHPKDFQAAVRNYVNGDSMPTGNPRKGFTQAVKVAAQKYGEDMGIPVSDATYQERLTHRREMASGKAGVGMQRTALRQGLEHLEGATKQAIELGNYGLGLAPLTETVNAVRGLTDAQKGKVTAFDNKIQTLAGEMGKFFSSAQGGGVHERQLTRERFKGITAPTVLADAIDSTLELMEGGLHAREMAQQQLFGGKVDPKLEYMTKDDRDRIEHIREMSRQLRGGTSAPAAKTTPPAGKTNTGVQWSIVE